MKQEETKVVRVVMKMNVEGKREIRSRNREINLILKII
jgi:hypothetical protein